MAGDTKSRGELGEIRSQLNALSSNASSKPETVTAKKDLFRKIINYVTIGIDMSSLFMQVMTVAVSNSNDVVLKKMLYQYICTYAQSNPDLTLLTINLLTKDCRDQDPTIRGLALRSLCSLRVANLVEYIVSPVQQGLVDAHPYIRRTAVMGVLKIWNLDQATVENSGLVDKVMEMVESDKEDAQVMANCMSVLEQVGFSHGLLTRVFVIKLLNRIKDFSEWAQCQVLEFVAGYRPKDEQEVFDMMNVLDDRLAHSNSALVLATVKLFLHYTLNMPATHQQVLERIKSPLQTLISRDHYETAYVVLAHFLLIVQRAPAIFSSIYRSFYCRVNEPSYIKLLKLQILAALADESNAYEIVTELNEYVNDIDVVLSRAAVRAVGEIALEVSGVEGIVERLLGFLEAGKEHVTAETLVVLVDVLRRFPHIAEVCIAALAAISPADLEEPAARAAFVWILGELGHSIQDAPYLLEGVGAGWDGEEVGVKQALLTAAARLFFRRPPECQALLGRLLAAACQDSNTDVHDRGLLYYRLFQHSVMEAQRVIGSATGPLTSFSEQQSAELRDRIFDEFNSLAVVYQAPSSSFVEESEVELSGDLLDGGAEEPGSSFVDEGSALLDGDAQAEPLAAAASAGRQQQPADALLDLGPLGPPNGRGAGPAPAAIPTPAAASAAAGPVMDLLGLDDLLGALPSTAAPPPAAVPPPLALVPAPQLAPADFQQAWARLQPAASFNQPLAPRALAALEANRFQDFLKHMAAARIATMASGGAPPLFRFYFHAQAAASGARLLVETIVDKGAGAAAVTVKADDVAAAAAFGDVFRASLASFAT